MPAESILLRKRNFDRRRLNLAVVTLDPVTGKRVGETQFVGDGQPLAAGCRALGSIVIGLSSIDRVVPTGQVEIDFGTRHGGRKKGFVFAQLGLEQRQ